MVRIDSVYTGLVVNWNGTVPYRVTFISGPICTKQWIRSVPDPPGPVQTQGLSVPISYQFQTDPVPCKGWLSQIKREEQRLMFCNISQSGEGILLSRLRWIMILALRGREGERNSLTGYVFALLY